MPGVTDGTVRLDQILDEYRVHSYLDVIESLGHKKKKDLDGVIYTWFAAYREQYLGRLRRLNGFNLCLGWEKRKKNQSVDLSIDTVFKRMLTLSHTPILLTPAFTPPGSKGQTVPDIWYELLFHFRDLILTGQTVLLPAGVKIVAEDYGLKSEQFVLPSSRRLVQSDWLVLRHELPGITVFDLSNERLKAQMSEVSGSTRYFSGGGQVYLYLPQLTGVPLQTLVELRAAHGDVFNLYNSTVADFFERSSNSTTEKKLLEVMQKTDEEIRRIEGEFTKLMKAKTLQLAGASVKLGVGVLSAFVPPDLGGNTTKLLGSFFGVGGFNDLMKYFELRSTSAGSESAFYFPWLLRREALD